MRSSECAHVAFFRRQQAFEGSKIVQTKVAMIISPKLRTVLCLWWQRILFPPWRAALLVLKSQEKVWKSTQRNVALAVSDHGQDAPAPPLGLGWVRDR